MSISQMVPREKDPTVEMVAANVRAELGRRKLTQTDMARILGLSKTGASKRYNGLTPYTLPDLGKLASALRITVAALCAARDSNPEPAGKGSAKVLPFLKRVA